MCAPATSACFLHIWNGSEHASKYHATAMQLKSAAAYSAYMMTATFLPTVVSAGVLFYGGHLVLQHRMSAGALMSFMLYQQSLSSSFQVHTPLSALLAALLKSHHQRALHLLNLCMQPR